MKNLNKFEASLSAPIGSSIPEKDTQIIQRPGWYQIVTPSVKEATVNEVIFSLVESHDADKRIEESFAAYRQHQLPFKWCIGPMSSPEIEAKISSRASATWNFRGMAINSSHQIPIPSTVTVERVDGQNFEIFLGVFSE